MNTLEHVLTFFIIKYVNLLKFVKLHFLQTSLSQDWKRKQISVSMENDFENQTV